MIKFQHGIATIAIVICTIIGGWGIITAPSSAENSDQKTLEQELARNAEFLQQQNKSIIKNNRTNLNNSKPNTAKMAANKNTNQKKETSITAIGDSVLLGAALPVQKAFNDIVIDAKISRQVVQALSVAKSLKKKGKLGNTIIIALGTNGVFERAKGQELINYFGKNRKIYWVNAYGKKLSWQKDVNKTIQWLADKNKNVHVIDWADEAILHPKWFYSDGIHLNIKGQKGYAKFLKRALKTSI